MRARLPTFRAVKHCGGYLVVKTDYQGQYSHLVLTRQTLAYGSAMHIVATLQRDQQRQQDFGKNGPYIGFPTLV